MPIVDAWRTNDGQTPDNGRVSGEFYPFNVRLSSKLGGLTFFLKSIIREKQRIVLLSTLFRIHLRIGWHGSCLKNELRTHLNTDSL